MGTKHSRDCSTTIWNGPFRHKYIFELAEEPLKSTWALFAATDSGRERVKRVQIQTLLEWDKALTGLGITPFTMIDVYNKAKERVEQAKTERDEGREVILQMKKNPADREDEKSRQGLIFVDNNRLQVPSGETRASALRASTWMQILQ